MLNNNTNLRINTNQRIPTNKKYLVAISAFPDFGPVRIKLLISYFKSAEKVWNLTKDELLKVGLKDALADKFIKHVRSFDIDRYFRLLRKLGVACLTEKERNYPINLKEIDNPPVVLYVLGNMLPDDKNAIAIIGSRKITSYGREVAIRFASELAGYGITIISGLALGIDAVAQKAAIDAGGRSIAVIASGLDRITPYTNYNLAREIVKKGGAVVSESPLGAEIFRSSFPIRNRIVSGLSRAVVVVEGARKSGTLLTASHAADQGRTVFAIPGAITSPMSEAPHFLLQNGAKWAFCPKDILDELSLEVKVDKDKVADILPDTKEQKDILKVLENEALHLDEIVRISKMKSHIVSSTLMSMVLKGMVKEVGGGVYKKV